jgi:hypothetical protein
LHFRRNRHGDVPIADGMKANQLFVLAIAAAAGCGAVTNSGAATGDDDMGSGSDTGSDMGSGSDTGSGSGSGSDTGSGSGSGSGSHPAGTLYGHINDERGDNIDFSSGVPVHNHVGASIDLSAGCPAVYKYAYLTSKAAPLYGRDATPNPLTYQIQADTASYDPSATSYRVRTDDNQTLLDWTPITPDGGGIYTMELHRDDSTGMAALGTRVGKMYIDVRLHDAGGTETLDTACWENHPLAAPLQVFPVASSTLFGMSLPAHSPISTMLDPASWEYFHTTGMDVVALPIVQMTAEPTAITIASPTPTGIGTDTGIDAYLPASVVGVNLTCGPTIFDPGCDKTTLVNTPTTTTAPLSAEWVLRVVDTANNNVVCIQAANDTTVSCTLPGRAANEAPHTYRAYLAIAQASIAPIVYTVTSFGEYTIGPLSYTGTAADSTTYGRCTHMKITSHGDICMEETTYAHAIVLDKAHIDFDSITFAMTSNVGEPSMPVVAPASLVFAAQSWDAGDAGL